MNLVGTKVLTLTLLGVICFVIGIATIPLRKYLGLQNGISGRRQMLVTSWLLCFGGGVLLATTMLHILPEVGEMLEATGEKIGMEFLPQLVMCSGFFIIYLVEEVVSEAMKHIKKSAELEHILSQGPNSGCCHTKQVCHNDMEINMRPNANGNVPQPNNNSNSSYTTFPGDQSQSIPTEKNPNHQSRVLRDFFTILALSVHCVFEGIAVGLESTNDGVWTMFAAISSHKFIITFCLCIELLQTCSQKVFFTYLTVFSIISPIGIGIGTAIYETVGAGGVNDVTVATLQGIAGGTLLYVVMFEILNREREKNVSGLFQLTGVLCGFMLMVLVQSFVSEPEHEDGGDDKADLVALMSKTHLINV